MKKISDLKKLLFALSLLSMVLFACNRNTFEKKLIGSWSLDRYLFAGRDMTASFDSTHSQYNLTINENQLYSETWKQYQFFPDSVILVDTLGYDTPNSVYIIHYDTLRSIDTVITPHVTTGQWDLINSEQDLQLRDNSDSANVRMYRILKLTRKELNIITGNQEYDLRK